MGAPKYARLAVDCNERFHQGMYLVGEIHAVKANPAEEAGARNGAGPPRAAGVRGGGFLISHSRSAGPQSTIWMMR